MGSDQPPCMWGIGWAVINMETGASSLHAARGGGTQMVGWVGPEMLTWPADSLAVARACTQGTQPAHIRLLAPTLERQ